jgi:hypothetical protein
VWGNVEMRYAIGEALSNAGEERVLEAAERSGGGGSWFLDSGVGLSHTLQNARTFLCVGRLLDCGHRTAVQAHRIDTHRCAPLLWHRSLLLPIFCRFSAPLRRWLQRWDACDLGLSAISRGMADLPLFACQGYIADLTRDGNVEGGIQK